MVASWLRIEDVALAETMDAATRSQLRAVLGTGSRIVDGSDTQTH